MSKDDRPKLSKAAELAERIFRMMERNHPQGLIKSELVELIEKYVKD